MTIRHQIETMLTMQDRMNRRIHSGWIDQDFAWYRALWIECGELIDHYGYKWWKKQHADMDQVRLEIVDIWHFGMSMLFDGRSIEAIAADAARQIENHAEKQGDVLQAAEALAADSLTKRRFSLSLFVALLHAADMTFDDLFERYVGKNVLNFFRQDHGYQEGTYRKHWDGREDNEHLAEVVRELNSGADDFAERLYQQLAGRYRAASEQR